MVLTWIDYLVIGGYLLAITAFGSYFARFQRTTRDYFLTGRSVPWWAICFTIVATETSTLTFISVPATAYNSDMTFLSSWWATSSAAWWSARFSSPRTSAAI
jgi:Na+/proline symporter